MARGQKVLGKDTFPRTDNRVSWTRTVWLEPENGAPKKHWPGEEVCAVGKGGNGECAHRTGGTESAKISPQEGRWALGFAP